MHDKHTTPTDLDAKPSCPESGHDAAIHPPGGYHVLRRVAGGYLAIATRRISRWDAATEPAWWENYDAAQKWAKRQESRTGHRCIVEPCDTAVAPCVLRPRRSGPRPVKFTLDELQRATGLTGGKAAILRAIAQRFDSAA